MNPTNVCRHLRTKKMFIPALAEPVSNTSAQDVEHSAHYWCNCTLTETGPDDQHVGAESCRSGRLCFEE